MDSRDMTPEGHDFVGKKMTANCRWTAIMTSFLLSCLVEQANLGLKSDKGFKSVAITVAAKAISARFNLVVNDTHINNRLRHVRKIWLIIKKLKDLSGVSWDDAEKKVIMGDEEYRTYIQAHPGEEVYINKPIQEYEEMTIVCGNDQATGSFVRTGVQSSRSVGARMEPPPPPSPVIDLDNNTQSLNDFDEVAPTQPPTMGTPMSSTSKPREGKNKAKRAKVDDEIIQHVLSQLGRSANALKANKSQFLSQKLFDEIMTLSVL